MTKFETLRQAEEAYEIMQNLPRDRWRKMLKGPLTRQAYDAHIEHVLNRYKTLVKEAQEAFYQEAYDAALRLDTVNSAQPLHLVA